MSVAQAVAVFLSSLVLNIVSSAVVAERVDQMGTWVGLSEGLLGLLTALAADAPEIASAVTAIVGGNHAPDRRSVEITTIGCLPLLLCS